MMSIKLQKQLNSLGGKLPGNLDHYLVSTPKLLRAWILMVGSRYVSFLDALFFHALTPQHAPHTHTLSVVLDDVHVLDCLVGILYAGITPRMICFDTKI